MVLSVPSVARLPRIHGRAVYRCRNTLNAAVTDGRPRSGADAGVGEGYGERAGDMARRPKARRTPADARTTPGRAVRTPKR